MNTPLDLAHAAVASLVRTFQQNEARYLAPQYQEAEARQDFIDKFWRALGWDVGHDTQTNPAEQEVKIERGVTVATAQKRADYAFFLAPNFRDVRFFVEAKKPSVNLNQNADAYFQATRYGWNANTPLAVLTDFEQFHILDCRAKPDIRTATQRLGVLNSSFIRWFANQTGTTMRGGWMSFESRFIRNYPIRPINFADPADKAQHDKMVGLVEQMLEAKQKLAAAQNEGDTNYYTRRCAQLDQQIDALVYALYGLTDAEIAIVEGRV